MGGKVKRTGTTGQVTSAAKSVGKKNRGKSRTNEEDIPKIEKSKSLRRSKRNQERELEDSDHGEEREHGKKEGVREREKRVVDNEQQKGEDAERSGVEDSDEDEKENDMEDVDNEIGDEQGAAEDRSNEKANEEGEDEDEDRFAKLVGVGEGWEDSDDEGAMETVAMGLLPGQVISDARNDEAGLERKLEEIAIFSGEEALPFWESLAVTMPLKEKLGDKLALDDLKRERRFAELATEAVQEGLERLRAGKMKFRRPGDYFAQMVKSDVQMGKVKDKLLFEKGKIEGAEKRRNNREIAKNRKKVRATQMEREQEKKRKAKEEIEAFSRLRKQRLKQREEVGEDGEDDGDEFPIDLLEVEQLDDENRFRPQKEIAEGKRKGWSAKKEAGDGGNGRKVGGKKAKGRDGGNGPNGGRVQKKKQGPRGKKKRLGKSRRKATKTRAD